MTGPRIGEIWELSEALCTTSAGPGRGGHLVRVVEGPISQDDGSGPYPVFKLRDLADDAELSIIGIHFEGLVRVHPPTEGCQ
jgi:hypothetical protein